MDYKRIDGKTPSGGDYSEIFYLDDQGNSVDSSVATRCMIHECTKDGRLIMETLGFLKQDFSGKREGKDDILQEETGR